MALACVFASACGAAQAPARSPVIAAPSDDQRVTVADVVATLDGDVVLLAASDDRVIPIPVDRRAAMHIASLQDGRPSDLLEARLLALTGAELVAIRLDGDDELVRATLVVRAQGNRHELEADPSDAIALAASQDVPLNVSAAVARGRAIPLTEILGP